LSKAGHRDDDYDDERDSSGQYGEEDEDSFSNVKGESSARRSHSKKKNTLSKN